MKVPGEQSTGVIPVIENIEAIKAVFVNNAGRILVLRRNMDHPFNPGAVDLPGGQIEPGETPESALSREFNEELNFDISGLVHREVGEFAKEIRRPSGLKHIVTKMLILSADSWNSVDPIIVIPDGGEHMSLDWSLPIEAEELFVAAESRAKAAAVSRAMQLQQQGELPWPR